MQAFFCVASKFRDRLQFLVPVKFSVLSQENHEYHENWNKAEDNEGNDWSIGEGKDHAT